jgi:HEAT repeat protein
MRVGSPEYLEKTTMLKRLIFIPALLSLAGCYSYGYKSQKSQFWRGVSPADDIRLVREGADARERREAILRVVRNEASFDEDQRRRLSSRKLLAYVTSSIHEPSPLVRATAASALRQVGTREEVPLLVRNLRGEAALELQPEPSPVVRRQVVETLGTLGGASEIPVLGAVLRTDVDVETRVKCAEALARIGTPRSVPPLLVGLSDADSSVAFACHEALVKVTGEKMPFSPTAWRQWWERTGGTRTMNNER